MTLSIKKVNRSLIKLLVFIFLALITNNFNQAKAAFVPVQCQSGACNLNLRINDNDISKVFPEAYPGFRIRLDLRPLRVNSVDSDHFRIFVYENTSSGVNIISSLNIKFPRKRSKLRNSLVIIDIPEFIGTKVFSLDIYKNNGDLSSTYRTTLNGFGNINSSTQNTQGIIYGQNLSGLVPSSTGFNLASNILETRTCPDDSFSDCNLEELFFHNFSVEASTIQEARQMTLLKEEDGTIKLRVPVVASRRLRSKRISSVKKDEFISADDPNVNPDPSLVNNQPVSISQVDELNIGVSGDASNFSIDPVNDELELSINNSAANLSFKNNSIGFDSTNHLAALDLERGTETNKPSIKLNNSPISNPPRNGSFEYSNNNLYFTANGVRELIVLDPSNQFSPNSINVDVKANLAGNANTLGNNSSSFFTNASNLNSGTISINHLPTITQIERLFNENTSKSMVLTGADDILMTSQADVNLTLPSSGTLATTNDLPITIPVNSIDSAKIIDDNLLSEDFSDNSITNDKIASLNASIINIGTVDIARLPNRDISDITNLTTELNDKLEITGIEDNLSSTNTNTALSANQGKVLKDLIDLLGNGFGTVNQNLSSTDIDFQEYHSVFTKTIDQNETFTAINLQQGHRAYLILQGEFNANFPSYFNLLQGTYNPEAINVIQLDVINDQARSELVHMKIFNLPRIDLLLSVRKVNTAYNGPCLRVRRSSDDAEANIYFTSSGDVDTTSLLNFVGAGNDGFVTKWFDQSFNGYHVEQSSPSLQAQIVNSGVLISSDNTIAALEFANDFLANADLQISPSFSILAVVASTVASQDESQNFIMHQGDNANGNGRGLFLENDLDPAAWNGSSAQKQQGANLNSNESYLIHYNFDEGNFIGTGKLYLDSNEVNDANLPAGGAASNNSFKVGRRSDQNNSYAEVKIQEIRIYNRSLSDTFRQDIESSINGYFNLY